MAVESMFATHSHSEAHKNKSGWFVDQGESPHIEPNHVDPMGLAAQCSVPWLRKSWPKLMVLGNQLVPRCAHTNFFLIQ